MKRWSQSKNNTHPTTPIRSIVDLTGKISKVRCCKEQYCIGTWNVRSMNHSKLEVVKQEMARVNTDILGMNSVQLCSRV